MIARLEGVLLEQRADARADRRGRRRLRGVRSRSRPSRALPDAGKTVALRIHTHAREGALQLFGFATAARARRLRAAAAREPRRAEARADRALGDRRRPSCSQAIRDGNAAPLRAVPGVGAKLAERILVELRDRVDELALAVRDAGSAPSAAPARSPTGRAAGALGALNLGYPRQQAERALERGGARASRRIADVETLVRAALPEARAMIDSDAERGELSRRALPEEARLRGAAAAAHARRDDRPGPAAREPRASSSAPRARAARRSITCSSTARRGSARPRSRASSPTRWARRCARPAAPRSSGPGDLAALLSNLEAGDVLFIDEIHRLAPAVEEILYPGDGGLPARPPDRRRGPARARCASTCRASRWSARRRARACSPRRCATASAGPRGSSTTRRRISSGSWSRSARRARHRARRRGAARELARRSRGTPRVANRLLRRVRDFAEVRGRPRRARRRRARALRARAARRRRARLRPARPRSCCTRSSRSSTAGPVGLETLAAAVGEDKGTLEDVVEPFLIQEGFLARTPRGRVATPLCYRHLGRDLPDAAPGQRKLF